jgi:hypothetical protein
MIRTLQIDRYQLRQVMDDFATAVDEDEKSIYYDQRIPYSSWKLLKKASKSSYQLDKTSYEPINFAIASSENCFTWRP